MPLFCITTYIFRYCAKSKRLFESLNEKFVALELDKHPQGAEIQAELAVMTGQRTVPNIFINGVHPILRVST